MKGDVGQQTPQSPAPAPLGCRNAVDTSDVATPVDANFRDGYAVVGCNPYSYPRTDVLQ
jgi:hypothetical protein